MIGWLVRKLFGRKKPLTLSDLTNIGEPYMWRCFLGGYDLHGYIDSIDTHCDDHQVTIHFNQRLNENLRLLGSIRGMQHCTVSLAIWHLRPADMEDGGDDNAYKTVMRGKLTLRPAFDRDLLVVHFYRDSEYTVYPHGCNIDVALEQLRRDGNVDRHVM